ncbi:MAG: hypothetical protein SGJ18_03825 [Pseudomonadota bacterium]|nr:hypothetical protein [Pseudomonadota bacterium]
MKRSPQSILRLALCIGTVCLTTGCAGVKFSTSANKVNGPVTPFSNPPICDIGTDPIDPDSGLQSDIYYLDQSQPRYKSVDEFISFGHRSNNPLFLSQLNVPTRMFDVGFLIDGGDFVRDEQNKVLIEYFALDIYSELRLTNQNVPGNYQVALLSDDGSILDAKISSDAYSTIVNNDGNHPTRLGCGATTLQMNADTRLPIRLKYFQGPRYHIALMMLWRKVNGTVPPSEPLCGVTGNETWFDPQNQQPTANFNSLLSRGWQVVKPNNFKLPNNHNNPCI